MSELTCFHRWSPWFDAYDNEGARWRLCSGLCRQHQSEGEPEPRVVIGRIE